jgi:hypothetical protein
MSKRLRDLFEAADVTHHQVCCICADITQVTQRQRQPSGHLYLCAVLPNAAHSRSRPVRRFVHIASANLLLSRAPALRI